MEPLELHPAWPLELRMRPRPMVRAAAGVLAESYLPKAAYAAALLGAQAGTITWATGLLLTDLSILPTPEAIDLTLGILFASLLGAALNGFEAYRRFGTIGRAAMMGLVVGALAGAMAMSLSLALREMTGTDPTFAVALLVRMAAWLLLGVFVQGGLGLLQRRLAARTRLSGLAIAAASGVLCAVVFNFRGPTALWHGVALLLLGGAVGYALTGVQFWGARAIVDVEAAERRAVGVVGARGVALVPGVALPLRPLRRRGGASGEAPARVVFDGQRLLADPPPGAIVRSGLEARIDGKAIDATMTLGDGDAIDVEGTRYRVHLLAATGP
ncbi:MAG: hypothetical protein IPK33_03095 [Gemmatimonadetes bacterium]|nr:hypothetical protein [Gemmatimonadota bacterium]